MNKFHKKAIELKYKGNTYREISKALGKRITELTLKDYFRVDGLLYVHYLEYEARMNEWTEEESRKEYKRLASFTSKMQMTVLKQAVKAKDWRLANDIIKDINDRAGLVVVRKTELDIETSVKKVETYEQFTAELKRLGIDSETGLRVETSKMAAN